MSWKNPICALPIHQYSPSDYFLHIKSLYAEVREKELKQKKVTKEFSLGKTKKGLPLLRVRRNPKYLTYVELEELSLESIFSTEILKAHALKKKIKVVTTKEDLHDETKTMVQLSLLTHKS